MWKRSVAVYALQTRVPKPGGTTGARDLCVRGKNAATSEAETRALPRALLSVVSKGMAWRGMFTEMLQKSQGSGPFFFCTKITAVVQRVNAQSQTRGLSVSILRNCRATVWFSGPLGIHQVKVGPEQQGVWGVGRGRAGASDNGTTAEPICAFKFLCKKHSLVPSP